MTQLETLLVTAVTTMWASLIYLAITLRKDHIAHKRDMNELHAKSERQTEMVTEALVKSSIAIENNTRVVDKLMDNVTKATKR